MSLARTLDIPRASANFRFFATAVLHTASDAHLTDHSALNYTVRRPRGVAGLISPWNLPLYLLSWKIAPALATGNTAVAKPSELTPLTASLLADICVAAGLPAGVLNIVHGAGGRGGSGARAHPDVTDDLLYRRNRYRRGDRSDARRRVQEGDPGDGRQEP